jgi:branched-chain amino acid transport system permease protein
MPRIGQDEWVASVEERTGSYTGFTAPARRMWDRVAPGWRLLGFAVVAAAFPFTTDSDYLIRVGLNVLLFGLLAIGLNVVVGWAGMLDLGYVAFYGFGAYGYAFVSSDQFDLHWPTEATIVVVVVATALLGLLLGLPSRRLLGDYLAIITLFFAQMFVEIATNLDRLEVPWSDEPLSITGGPNGITSLDEFEIFGVDFAGLRHYFYFLLIVILLAVVGFWNLDRSRTGRAWRAIREDPLAAETMGVLVNRLRLLAFVFGAATAGLAGTVFAAVQANVFPQNFEVLLLVMIYAALVLGGTGSIPGAILGAIVIASVPQILRPNEPDTASWLFYLTLGAGLAVTIRPWKRVAAVAGGILALGFATRAIVAAMAPVSVADGPARDSSIAEATFHWVVVLEDGETAGNVVFVAVILAALALTFIQGPWRLAALVPAAYAAAFVWENRLVLEPSVTAQLLFGALLVILMASRPQGLLGTPRVEIT